MGSIITTLDRCSAFWLTDLDNHFSNNYIQCKYEDSQEYIMPNQPRDQGLILAGGLKSYYINGMQ